MKHVSLLLACLGLLAAACSGGNNGSGASGAHTGGDATTSVGGSSTSGGALDKGGAVNADAGMGGGGGDVATGGANTTAGAAGTPTVGDAGDTSGGAGGQGGAAAAAIDYSIWVLQLPSGSGTPTIISSSKLLAGYSDAYFNRAGDGGQIFMDPNTGVTFSGSTRCRTELSESTNAGEKQAWSATGSNTMTVTGRVLKGSAVTIAQVFDGGEGHTLCELQYNGAGFSLFYEEALGAGSSVNLNTPVALNTQYTFTLSLSQGVLAVTLDGKQVYTHTPSAHIVASTFHFKVGNYDQGTSSGPVSTTPHSIVENYSVEVVHQ
jgi:hypothetical protein